MCTATDKRQIKISLILFMPNLWLFRQIIIMTANISGYTVYGLFSTPTNPIRGAGVHYEYTGTVLAAYSQPQTASTSCPVSSVDMLDAHLSALQKGLQLLVGYLSCLEARLTVCLKSPQILTDFLSGFQTDTIAHSRTPSSTNLSSS